MFTARGAEGGGPRLGLTVSRKVGNAVVRNRVKRRIREWFRRERGCFGGAWDVVVIARREAAALDFEASAQVLSGLVEQGAGR
jgi:ribonuclease P protein component